MEKITVSGIDLRDYFAVHAAYSEVEEVYRPIGSVGPVMTWQEARYVVADRMMEARKK